MGTAGTYVITNTASGKSYIGASQKVDGRLASHRRKLEDGVHPVARMQRDWTQCEGKGFTFEVVRRFDNPAEAYVDEVERIRDARHRSALYNTRWDMHPKGRSVPPAHAKARAFVASDLWWAALRDHVAEVSERTMNGKSLSEWIRDACDEKTAREITR